LAFGIHVRPLPRAPSFCSREGVSDETRT